MTADDWWLVMCQVLGTVWGLLIGCTLLLWKLEGRVTRTIKMSFVVIVVVTFVLIYIRSL